MITHRQIVWRDVSQILKQFKPGEVLDIGCQAPYFENEFEKMGFKWYGCDLNPIENHERLVKCDMNNMTGFDDDSFDFVFCCHAFEHSETPIQTLKEIKRVLKPGGILILATPNPCEHQILNADDDHIFVLNQMQMERLFRYVGFEKLAIYRQEMYIEKIQDYNIISVGRKP